MEEFDYLYNAKLNNKRFCVFSNANYEVYVLEILEDEKLSYPQYEDFVTFYKKIQEFKKGKIKYQLNVDKEECNSTGKKKLSRFRFIPKVIKRGVLITALAAMLLSGCATAMESSTLPTENVTLVQQASEVGFEIEYLPKLDKYIGKSYVEDGKKHIICTTSEEMKQYFPDVIQNPTYDDVRYTIQQNKKIPEEYKIEFEEILDKMEIQFPQIDLFVLNLNAERMRVRNGDLIGANGVFYSDTGEIVYDKNASDFTKAHELGHAIMLGEFETEDVIVSKHIEFPEFRVISSGEQFAGQIVITGSAMGEALADAFAGTITGEQQSNKSPYAPLDYHLEMFFKSCDYTVAEMIDEGVLGLAEAMTDNCVNKAFRYISYEDNLLSRYNIYDYDEDWPKYLGITINYIPEVYFADLAEERLAEGDENVIEYVGEIITSTSFSDGVYFVYGSGDEQRIVDSSTPEELVQRVTAKLVEVDKRYISGVKDFFDDLTN